MSSHVFNTIGSITPSPQLAQWPQIIVLSGADNGFAEMIASKGHHVGSNASARNS